MKQTETYSSLQTFKSCRAKYFYRYVQGIVPSESPIYYAFGSAMHLFLEWWFSYVMICPRGLELSYKYEFIIDPDVEILNILSLTGILQDHKYPSNIIPVAIHDALKEFKDKMTLQDMIKFCALAVRYVGTYPGFNDGFSVLEVENEFKTPVLTTKGRRSGRFELRGKIDGVVLIDNEPWILEHKTTSSITDAYIDRINYDLQIALYAAAWERENPDRGPVVGAIYDIIEKPQIRMKEGETDEQFEARRAALIAKSKTGTTTAKKQEPETVQQFYQRCLESITDNNFKRVKVRFSEQDKRDVEQEIFDTCKEIRACLKAKKFYRNTKNCTSCGACEYMKLCKARGNISEVEPGAYIEMAPHSELTNRDEMEG